MADSYKTIKAAATAEIVEKRSRFIAAIAPASTEQQAEDFITSVKKEHFAAKHNCFAYILRSGKERYSDDAEPQGTAGMPMLEVLRKSGLCDCVVVVTRYFGGILLGAGGLVRAYSGAVAEGIKAAGISEMKLYSRCLLSCDYTRYGRLPAMIAQFDGRIENTEFTDTVDITFFLPVQSVGAFEAALTEFSCGDLSIQKDGEQFLSDNPK